MEINELMNLIDKWDYCNHKNEKDLIAIESNNTFEVAEKMILGYYTNHKTLYYSDLVDILEDYNFNILKKEAIWSFGTELSQFIELQEASSSELSGLGFADIDDEIEDAFDELLSNFEFNYEKTIIEIARKNNLTIVDSSSRYFNGFSCNVYINAPVIPIFLDIYDIYDDLSCIIKFGGDFIRIWI